MAWTDWKWQLQNRITDLEGLSSKIHVTEEERKSFPKTNEFFQFAVTPYYLSLVDAKDPNCPIRKQIVPTENELKHSPNEWEDPLAEESHMPVKGVTHRYPDRAIWYLSHVCAVYCRFCTRKRKVSEPFETPNKKEWEEAFSYFESRTDLREIILSGGDPLTLSDEALDSILGRLKAIPHINQIRIHTRHPVTLPMRITEALCAVFANHFPIYMVTHFNHPKEVTETSAEAIRKLVTKGHVSVMNQSVLLRGINDRTEILSDLNYKLIKIGVKPYYLHQCDEVFGSSHFVVPIEEGIRIHKTLRGFHSGITIPQYVKDLTGGGGKVLLVPNSYEKTQDGKFRFRNFKGKDYDVSH